MGWYYSFGAKKSDVIRENTQDWNGKHARGRCLRKCVRGNILWTVWEITPYDGQSRRHINCDHMEHLEGEGWGYKSMDESMGPCYYSCPLCYLDMVPVANEKWRLVVRAYHAKRKSK